MPNFMRPTFEETCFICKDCGHMFQGRDCKEGQQEMLTGPLSPAVPVRPAGAQVPRVREVQHGKEYFCVLLKADVVLSGDDIHELWNMITKKRGAA